MGDRYTADTTSPTNLNFLFYKNGTLFDANDVRQVTIHENESEAENDINIIETIYGYDTKGYADIKFFDYLVSTAVPAIPTNTYSLNIDINGAGASDITFSVDVTDTWGDILASINLSLAGAVASIVSTSIRITSDLTGATSSMIVADGTTGAGGGFVAAANTALTDTATYPSPVDGVDNQIVNTSTGTYNYIASTIAIAGTYHDKIFITPEVGLDEVSFTNEFIVIETAYTGDPSPGPGDADNCVITGTLKYGDGSLATGVVVTAVSYNDGIISGTNDMMLPDPIQIVTESDGTFELELLRFGRFVITIKETGFFEVINVPDQPTVDLFSLIGIGEVADGSPDDDGQENW